jgi:tetratricopeptide (TPR) repeat protein
VNLPSILPPSDLLRQVEGIESGLKKQRRLGALGWLGAAAAVVQAMAVVLHSDYWDNLVSFNWSDLLYGAGGTTGLLHQWPFLLALAVLLASVLLIAWRRFWLKESQEPFRYTFAVDDFAAITREDPSLVWLQHHLSERLNERIGRLSLLEEAAEPVTPASGGDKDSDRKRGAPAPRYESHIHIRGHYGIRVDRDQWIVEVIPRVRVGPRGSAETMGHPETYPLNPAFKGGTQTEPVQLDPEAYEKLVERVYFSVATEIYRQISKDVQHKIDLLPTSYLRATAYLHEARDYARSNTLVAFDEAERLFDAAIRLYDPSRRPWPTSAIRWPGYLLRRVAAVSLRFVRWLGAFAWSRAARTATMVAKAQIGYANVLLDRRSLAGMSGYRLNPIFEARPIVKRAVRTLKRLPKDVGGVPESLFDAHVTLALTWAFIGSLRKARIALDDARRLLPTRATTDARFAYADGTIETRPRSRLLRFQRAVELDPKSEAAQFAYAFEAEKLWRTRPGLEADSAETIIEEYERVLALNPGNIATWGNLGYIQWLLADGRKKKDRLEQARQYFERGRDYKDIKRETYVAEIDYGLARIAAETGDFNRAYSCFTSALTAHMAQSTSQSYTDSWSALSDYYFVRIDLPMLRRFQHYKEKAERLHGNSRYAPDVPQRVRDAVLAFVVNDYGEACANYFKRSGDGRYLEHARTAYLRSTGLDRSYAIPRYNLFLLNKTEAADEAEEDAEKLYAIEPDWFEAKLAIMWKRARDARNTRLGAVKTGRQSGELWQASFDASQEASAEASRASVYEPPQKTVVPDQLTPYMKPKQARMKTAEAKRLERRATKSKDRCKDLLGEAKRHEQEAQKVLRQLVPHHWLWQGRLSRSLTPEKVLMNKRTAWRRWRLNWEWRWEREFDNVHVKALYDWGQTLLSPGSPRRSPSDSIFAHIEEHFWQDNFDIVHHFREQVEWRLQDVATVNPRMALRMLRPTRASLAALPNQWLRFQVLFLPYLTGLPRPDIVELRYQKRIDKYNEILACTLRADLDDDPTGYWALSGLNDKSTTVARGKAAKLRVRYTTLNRWDRQKFLVQVLNGQTVCSPALYRWVGGELQTFRGEIAERSELGQALLKVISATRDRRRDEVAKIRKTLESRDWCGLEGSSLAEYRRALKARDVRKLSQIATPLVRSDGDVPGRLPSPVDLLRQYEIKAYEAAMRSDDPELLWSIVAPLQLLGQQEQSRQALHAYNQAIGPSTDPTILWNLAVGYQKLQDWQSARETFQRALRADEQGGAPGQHERVRHADLYHWEIACVLWSEERYRDALDELDLVTGQAPEWREMFPDQDEFAVPITFVNALLDPKSTVSIPSSAAYRTLRTWLERHQRVGSGPKVELARRHAGRALLQLARARRQQAPAAEWSVVDRFSTTPEMLPVVAPVMLHADAALFPASEAAPVKRMVAAYQKMAGEISKEMGIQIPGIVIRASKNPDLEDRRYVVKLHEIALMSGTAARNHAEQGIVSKGIGPVVRQYLDTYLGFAEAHELVDQLRDQLEDTPPTADTRRTLALVRQVSSSAPDRLRFVQVLQRLVREAIPVTELPAILRALSRSSAAAEVDQVVDMVREALVAQLPRAAEGISLGPRWEATVARWVQHRDGKRFLAVPASEESLLPELLDNIATRILEVQEPVIVVRDDLRRFVRRLTAARFPFLPVLARREWAGSAAELVPLEAAPQPERVAS